MADFRSAGSAKSGLLLQSLISAQSEFSDMSDYVDKPLPDKTASSLDGGSPSPSVQLVSERVSPIIFKRILNRFDLVALTTALIYYVANSSGLVSFGPYIIGLAVIVMIVWYIPTGIATAELGLMFPAEGGIYNWASKGLGKFFGFFAGWLNWIAIFSGAFFVPNAAITMLYAAMNIPPDPTVILVCTIAFEWLAASIAMLRLRVSQNFINVVFVAYFVLSLGLLGLGGWYAMSHGLPAGTNLSMGSLFNIPSDIFVWGFGYAFLIEALIGFDTPLNMGAEIRTPRKTILQGIAISLVLSMVLYIITLTGLFYILPFATVNSITGVVDAIRVVAPGIAGISGIILMFYYLSNATFAQYMWSRLVVVSGIDKYFPSVFAYINKSTRAPIVAIAIQAIGGNLFTIWALSNVSGGTGFLAGVALIGVFWIGSYIFLFLAALAIRYRKGWRDMQRPFKPPGAWLIYSVGVVTSIIGVITAFFVPSPTIPTNTWLTTISVPTAAGVIIGIVIYLLGRKKAAGVSMDAEIEKYAKHLGLDAKAATAEE
jgi:glutamate:GABA antiporter